MQRERHVVVRKGLWGCGVVEGFPNLRFFKGRLLVSVGEGWRMFAARLGRQTRNLGLKG